MTNSRPRRHMTINDVLYIFNFYSLRGWGERFRNVFAKNVPAACTQLLYNLLVLLVTASLKIL